MGWFGSGAYLGRDYEANHGGSGSSRLLQRLDQLLDLPYLDLLVSVARVCGGTHPCLCPSSMSQACLKAPPLVRRKCPSPGRSAAVPRRFSSQISRKFPSTSWYTRCWCSGTRGGPHQKSAAEVRLGGAMLQLGLILPRPAVDYASAGAQRPFVLERLHRSTSAKRGKQSMKNNNILNTRATSSGLCIAPLTSLVPPSHFNFEVK